MKKTFMIFSLVVFMIASAYAQEGRPEGAGGRPNPEEFRKKQVEMMKKELNLTDVQVAKIDSAFAEMGKKMEASRSQAQGTEDRDKMREQMMAMREENDKALQKILTPDQYKKWQEIQEKMRSERRGGPGGPGGQGAPDGERGGQRGGGGD
jgi:Spy/CpxP family protein refolding chaperone